MFTRFFLSACFVLFVGSGCGSSDEIIVVEPEVNTDVKLDKGEDWGRRREGKRPRAK